MAEGGREFGYEDKGLDSKIDDDNLIDFHSDEEVDTTRPFQSYKSSTPYQEQYEMQTMRREQSGLPDTSYEETPFLGSQKQSQRSWDALTRHFPDASSIDLETSYSKTGRLLVKMAGFGKKAYELFTKDRSGRQQLNPKLTKEIKQSLGGRAEQYCPRTTTKIRRNRKRASRGRKNRRRKRKRSTRGARSRKENRENSSEY